MPDGGDVGRTRRSLLLAGSTIGTVALAGCTADTDTEEPEANRIPFEELYGDAERKAVVGETASQNTGPLDPADVAEMVDASNSTAENVAIAASQASQHTRVREDTPATIRYILDEVELDAFADTRTVLSGGYVTITEIYAANDDGSVQKVMVTKVPHNTDIPLQYSLIAGEEPGDGGAASDNNLAGMWNPTNLANISPVDYETLANRVEDYGGREEIGEEEFRNGWETFHRYFNSYLLAEGSGRVLAPTADAWRYIGEQERISRQTHEQALENFRSINEVVETRDIGDDQYLAIDFDGDGLSFDVVDSYHPAEIHDF